MGANFFDAKMQDSMIAGVNISSVKNLIWEQVKSAIVFKEVNRNGKNYQTIFLSSNWLTNRSLTMINL